MAINKPDFLADIENDLYNSCSTKWDKSAEQLNVRQDTKIHRRTAELTKPLRNALTHRTLDNPSLILF